MPPPTAPFRSRVASAALAADATWERKEKGVLPDLFAKTDRTQNYEPQPGSANPKASATRLKNANIAVM